MNAIWDAKRRRMEAPRKAEPAPRPARKAKQKKATAAERLACVHRSADAIGKLECGCPGKPEIFECVKNRQCILVPLRDISDGTAAYSKAGKLAIGGTKTAVTFIPWFFDKPAGKVSVDPIGGIERIAVCELCDARQAPERPPESTPAVEQPKPAEPFPLASDATAAARVVICKACDKRDACGKPEAAARWALEACPDGRWRTEH